MRPRSRSGPGPFKLAIWPAMLLLGFGVTASATGVVGPAAPFDVRPDCLVVTVGPGGDCPVPGIAAPGWVKPATISLCAESLCGRGFRPSDTILVLATRAEGSTFWRIKADRRGNFRSPLPAPLCRFAPIDLAAFGNQGERSDRLSLASVGCLVFGP